MFRVFTFSEAGGHPVNEDAFEVRAHPATADCLLCALGDGQGGQPGGARAAQLACRTTVGAATDFAPNALLAPSSWGRILRQADQAVMKDKEAGFTTLIGFAVRDHKVFGASSGDSALLAFDRSGRVMDLTRSQVKNPPVGFGSAVLTPFAAEVQPPWLVLAMSDGVWKYAGWDRLKETASRLRGQALIDSLQQSARLKGSGRFQDDFTLIVIQDSD